MSRTGSIMSGGHAILRRVDRPLLRAIREAGGLHTAAQLAERWGLTPQAVSAMARRNHDFPEPILIVGRVRLYAGNEAEDWRAHRKD